MAPLNLSSERAQQRVRSKLLISELHPNSYHCSSFPLNVLILVHPEETMKEIIRETDLMKYYAVSRSQRSPEAMLTNDGYMAGSAAGGL